MEKNFFFKWGWGRISNRRELNTPLVIIEPIAKVKDVFVLGFPVGVHETEQEEDSTENDHPEELRNHNRIVFEEMTSWKALTWHKGIKTAF